MSRDAFSDDPRDELPQESRSSNGRTNWRSTEPYRPIEMQLTNQHTRIDAEQLQLTQRKPEVMDTPQAHYLGDLAYFLRESELQTLVEVGTFRAVAANDLASISYDGDTQRMEREIRRLKEQSLVSEKAVRGDRNHTIRLFALTKRGLRLARKSGIALEEQVIDHGFVKPREAKHDADLYRLYNAQAERIEKAGGRITRVVLDYELKRNLNRGLVSFYALREDASRLRRVLDEREITAEILSL